MKLMKVVRYTLGSTCLAAIAGSLGAKLWSLWGYGGRAVDGLSWNLKFFGDRLYVFLGFGIPLAILLFYPALARLYEAIKDKLTR